MYEIGQTLVSDDLRTEEFICNLGKCKGICCVEGDSGAPLEEDELQKLEEIYSQVEPYLTETGKKAIQEQDKYIRDVDGDWVTPLVNDRECAYTIFDAHGMAKCGIEQAHRDGKTDFPKPISCHLYPVRLTEYTKFTAVNYHQWEICSDACELGKELKTPVYKFLKEPLIRKFGNEWYQELEQIIDQNNNQSK